MDAEQQAAKPAGGLLGRFENVRTKRSCKRNVICDAATPAYFREDFLKPTHMPIDRVDQEANYHALPNVNETRFHRGFQRRNMADIQSDAARLEHEVHKEMARESRAQASIEAARIHKATHTFNILTGEGEGRDPEFREVGKKIVNPYGCMEAVFADHSKDSTNRIKNSKHRFFQHDAGPKVDRMKNLFNEGLNTTVRETAILGYGSAGVRRSRSVSTGVCDNFAHVRGHHPSPDWEKPHYGNASQIIFG
eukprot:TRINITY_DN81532_c0_g1_i1.p1 TRINITY_DN81532_c0_g1~~TRINITY_DN81532_c0_g1_i1.p1  ORF type:complete len:250 (-),score=37.07 TRINITY_DN81532_c0_g1_i1:65-814(-)